MCAAELLRRDRRYHRDAYFFVFEALRFAQEQLGIGGMVSDQDPDEERHVTGQQLCEAILNFARAVTASFGSYWASS